MPKDIANIYNLSEEDFNIEKQNLWKDVVPGTADLADNLLRKIENDETPYVLSVEASYGMGKTYFFSRFCEYAKDNNYHCVYISAWENDYQPSPFCFIASVILDYLTQTLSPTTKSAITVLTQKAVNVTKKLLSSSSIQVGFNVKFFSMGIETDLGKLCESFLETKDEVKEFKKKLNSILCENHIKPLIIIIDELDRCRPDYALKTLEIIKHFFDVSNLYIILPINNEALVQAVQSTYGQMVNSENYLRKLITENYNLPISNRDDYKKIVETRITKEKLKKLLKNKYIENNDSFNGFGTIIENITKYAFNGKLTYREVIKVCDEFISIVRNIPKKIMVEYLAYKLCFKYRPDDVKLNSEHPFKDWSLGLSFRRKITSINDLKSITYDLYDYLEYDSFQRNYRKEVMDWKVNSDNFNTYESFYKYVNGCLILKSDVLKINMRPYGGREKFQNFFRLLEDAKEKALKYQQKYGSSDNDASEKAYYDKIIENNLCLYCNKKTKK